MKKLIKISELSKHLNLINFKNKKPANYTLRYWEKEFSQIKPKIINKQRYYSNDQIKIIKMIAFLLKEKGLTIKAAKNVLNSNSNKLDVYNSDSLKAEYLKNDLKNKTKLLLNKIKSIKRYGKKNTH